MMMRALQSDLLNVPVRTPMTHSDEDNSRRAHEKGSAQRGGGAGRPQGNRPRSRPGHSRAVSA